MDNTWKKHINLGNAAIKNNDLDQAHLNYISALNRAKLLFESLHNREDTIIATTISYLNLADCYLGRSKKQSVDNTLESAMRFLAIAKTKQNSQKEINAIDSSFKHLYTYITEYRKRYPQQSVSIKTKISTPKFHLH